MVNRFLDIELRVRNFLFTQYELEHVVSHVCICQSFIYPYCHLALLAFDMVPMVCTHARLVDKGTNKKGTTCGH